MPKGQNQQRALKGVQRGHRREALHTSHSCHDEAGEGLGKGEVMSDLGGKYLPSCCIIVEDCQAPRSLQMSTAEMLLVCSSPRAGSLGCASMVTHRAAMMSMHRSDALCCALPLLSKPKSPTWFQAL